MAKIMLGHVLRPEPIEVELQRAADGAAATYTALVDNERTEIEFEEAGPGAGWMRIRGLVTPFHVNRGDKRIEVWMAGRTYVFEVVDRTLRRAGASAVATGAIADLTAPMPGTILSVAVSVGDIFEAHAPLIIMESMKMEMTLSAPTRGRVAAIVCEVGQLVEMGAFLVKLEAAGDA